MDRFNGFLENIAQPAARARAAEVLAWVGKTYPALQGQMKWNQPMFTDHGTFILGFSASKEHLAVAPESVALDHFRAEIAAAGYRATRQLFRIGWEQPVDYGLLRRIIDFNLLDKSGYETFWRR